MADKHDYCGWQANGHARPEWAVKPMRRRALRLCDWCLKTRRRCWDSMRQRTDRSWKSYRKNQYRITFKPVTPAESDLWHTTNVSGPRIVEPDAYSASRIKLMATSASLSTKLDSSDELQK